MTPDPYSWPFGEAVLSYVIQAAPMLLMFSLLFLVWWGLTRLFETVDEVITHWDCDPREDWE